MFLRKKLERLCDRGGKTAALQLPLEHLDVKIPLAQTGKRLLRREDMDCGIKQVAQIFRIPHVVQQVLKDLRKAVQAVDLHHGAGHRVLIEAGKGLFIPGTAILSLRKKQLIVR